ncbi:hypothetical protein [Bombella saccharophila]|uniref:Uncharacterized protein n=1 Tax=Bombella saccharophila TaxID=2967338 RepID=A0ABT3W4Z2_9PROT|nr:hypothetical protein [Bombella saccharophila]MCX5614150.1 hypothetical protein [Bombella saccharophila]
MRGFVAGILCFVAFVLMPGLGVCADGIPPIEEGLKMVAAQQQYALQRMGLSAALARQALWGAKYKPESMCAQHVSLLLSGYDALHPEFPDDGPPDKDRQERIRLANSGSWRFVYDIEQVHICSKAFLDKTPAKPVYNPEDDPVQRMVRHFQQDRQGVINEMVEGGIDRSVAENAAILVSSQKGRYKECAQELENIIYRRMPGMPIGREDAREMNTPDPNTAERDCDIGRMYQDPNAEDPYAPSIERLLKAFREDRKGTIKRLKKVGVRWDHAEDAADLVLAQKGRYWRCAVIVGGLLDNMGYEWGDITHHVDAINKGYYTIGGYPNGGGGSGVGDGVCDVDNMNQNPQEGLW